MALGWGSYGLGLLAGILSTLSPCVLPIVPILLGSAAHGHPRAAWALAAGLALSYALVGTALAWAGAALGLDAGIVHRIGAVALGVLGVVLLSASLQQRYGLAVSGVGDVGHRLMSGLAFDGLPGAFAIGLTLGVVWSPCVGPTLGAAVVLAAQGVQLVQVALLMGLFGVGAALPVVALGLMSRQAWAGARGRWRVAGQAGRVLLGASLLVIAAVILSGADKPLETWVVDHTPDWLTRLTTRF